MLVVVDEEAGEREREQVGAQEAVVIDGVAPGLADAAGGGEPAQRDAAEDVREHVPRQARRLVLHVLLPPVVAASSGGVGRLQLLVLAAGHRLAARTRSGAGAPTISKALVIVDLIWGREINRPPESVTRSRNTKQGRSRVPTCDRESSFSFYKEPLYPINLAQLTRWPP